MFFAGFDLLFSILFPILFLVVLGMILYAIIGNIRTWNKNNHSPRLTVPAAVVAKRTEVSHHHTDNTMMHTFTTYYVTFQVESGDRMELTVDGSEYGMLAHRGISSVLMKFQGRAGHASGQQDAAASALHQAVRWGDRALDHVQSLAHARFGGLTGLRFNIGRIEGGIKANMIAPQAELRFGFRPLPSMDIDALLATFAGFAEPAAAHFEETFRGPSLPSGDIARAEERRLAARDVADALGLSIGNAVDFWTEASLFSAGGYTALVYGPGDIAQAHTADEFVTLAQLQRYADSVDTIINGAR